MAKEGETPLSQMYCNLCQLKISEPPRDHLAHCLDDLLTQSKENDDPFVKWKVAVALDRRGKSHESASTFKEAAQSFFDLSVKQNGSSKALLEYSTLMDAFSEVARARDALAAENFAEASEAMTRASEVLRSTMHFAFLAPYVSACAMMNAVSGLESGDPDSFEAYRSTNALLEQARFSLGFMDEKHPLILVIDSLLKLSISGALHCEASSLGVSGPKELASEKEFRSSQLKLEHDYLALKSGLFPGIIEFFPLRDFNLRTGSPFFYSYPDSNDLWLVNVGEHPAVVQRIGSEPVSLRIESMSSQPFPLKILAKGKIRIKYQDPLTDKTQDSGSLTLV